MTLQQFRSCSNYVQQQLLRHQAVFLSERRSMDWNILLFQLESFYVEVYYERKTQKVELIKSFDDMDQLDPYLRKIDVLALMN
ncbi:MAG TPA: hypothetical protein VFQ73_11190 [Flavisolibacter sp.]|nr:hypothetical protein [Flavisolibacter sp.]